MKLKWKKNPLSLLASGSPRPKLSIALISIGLYRPDPFQTRPDPSQTRPKFTRFYPNFRTDDDLTAYTETVQKTKKFPVLGKNSVIKFIAKAQVKRISLAGNNISSVSLIENLASTVKNTLLEISFA